MFVVRGESGCSHSTEDETMSGPQSMFAKEGPLTEAELVELEQRVRNGDYRRAQAYVPVRMVARLVQDNRRLKNLLLDFMAAEDEDEQE